MIIRSAARRVGDLASHLIAESNETVIERTDLDRDCPRELPVALQLMQVLAETANCDPRVRHLVHVKISPSKFLTDEKLARAIEVYEREHRIPATTPRKVIVHAKGNRPQHGHVLYALYDPQTARALKTQNLYENDEMASRLLEIEFKETITPGPRLMENISELRKRGMHREATILAKYAPAQAGKRLSDTVMRTASQIGVDANEARDQIFLAWQACQQDPAGFGRQLEQRGIHIAMGHTAPMAVFPPTGFSISIIHAIRTASRKGKASTDNGPKLENFRNLFSSAPPLDQVVNACVSSSLSVAETLVEEEFAAAARAAAASFQADELTRIRDLDNTTAQDDRHKTLKAKRAAILAAHKMAAATRRRAVERAWSHAHFWRSKALHKNLVYSVSGVALIAGASLPTIIMTMATASFIVAAKQKHAFNKARDLTAESKVRNQDGREALRVQMDALYRPVRDAAAFNFDHIPKYARIVAGYVFHAARNPSSESDRIEQARTFLEASRPGLPDVIEAVAAYGRPKVRATFSRMFDPDNSIHTRALEQALITRAPRLGKARVRRDQSGFER